MDLIVTSQSMEIKQSLGKLMLIHSFIEGLFFGLGFGLTYFPMEYFFPKLIKNLVRKKRRNKKRLELKVLKGGIS